MHFRFIADKITAYTDYVYNLDKMTAYVSNKKRLDAAGRSHSKLTHISINKYYIFLYLVLISASNLFEFLFFYFCIIKIYRLRINVPPSHDLTTPFSILVCISIVQSLSTDVTYTSKPQEFQTDGAEFLQLYFAKLWSTKKLF